MLHDPQHPSYVALPTLGTCPKSCKPLPVANLIRVGPSRRPAGSLVLQRLERVELRRPPRGEDRRHDPDEDRRDQEDDELAHG